MKQIVKGRVPKLTELVDIRILQRLQDGFSFLTGIPAIIRDPEGRPVTRVTCSSCFCSLVMRSKVGGERCRESNRRACQRATKHTRPLKYICHAGLSQLAAPIRVNNVVLGTIVMGDMPEGEIDEKRIREIANEIGVPADELLIEARALPKWSEKQMRQAADFLQTMASALAQICYQGYELQAKIREVSALFEVSRLLTETLDPQTVLNVLARNATQLLNMKGCSIRLLDPAGKELVIKSFYNLSRRYLDKGPVLVERSAIDQEALKGRVVVIPDMVNDPRVLYPEDARREGIRSGVVIGLISKKKPIGTLHLYSATPHQFTRDQVRFLRLLGNQAAIAIENATLYHDSVAKREMEEELAVAAQIQHRLLPERPPQNELVEIAARSISCRQVGGDMYDFIPIDEHRLGVAIADVSGKGVPGALLMATTRAALRAQAETGRRCSQVLRRLNTILCRDTSPNQFVSLFYGEIHSSTRQLTYSNAGHNPPLLFREQKVVRLEKGGLVLGADPDEVYESGRISLQKGDVLLLYTDGITEAMDERGTCFGEERLRAAVQRVLGRPPATIIDAACEAARRFVGGSSNCDDMTIVAMKVK